MKREHKLIPYNYTIQWFNGETWKVFLYDWSGSISETIKWACWLHHENNVDVRVMNGNQLMFWRNAS